MKAKETRDRILEYRLRNPTATQAEIATALGLSRSHVSTVMNSPEYRAEANAIQKENILSARTALVGAIPIAAEALITIAGDPTVKPADRIRAAIAILQIVATIEAK